MRCHYCDTWLLHIPRQSGGHEGELGKFEQMGPIVELLQETVNQLGSLAEEVLLQWGEGLVTQRPQQPLLAEERVIAEQAGQGCMLGHRVSVGRQFLTKTVLDRQPGSVVYRRLQGRGRTVVRDITPDFSPLYTPAVLIRPSLLAIYTPWAHCCLLACNSEVRNALQLIDRLKRAHGHILFGFVCMLTLRCLFLLSVTTKFTI